MFCKSCGTENPETANFCKHCGQRIEKNKICPECGASNDANAFFCNQCGTRLSADAAPKRASVTPIDTAENEYTPAPLAAEKPKSAINWRKIVEICGWACAMTGLLCALVFTFLIGFGVTSDVPLVSSLIGNKNLDLYYFFSEGYDDVAKAVKEVTSQYSYTEFYELSQYLPLVLGTVVSAGVIVSVVTLSAIAVKRFVNRARGKEDKDFAKLTIAAYLSFLLGALMLLGLFATTVDAKYTGSSDVSYTNVHAGLALNDATVAGIAVGGCLLVLFLGCRVAVKGKKLFARDNLLGLIFGAAAVVVAGILFGFIPSGAIGFTVKQSNADLTITTCFNFFLEQVAERYTFVSIVHTAPVGETVVAILAQAVQFALLVVLVLCLIRALAGTYEEKRKKTLPLAIPVFALSCVYLGLSVALGELCQSYMATDYPLHYTAPIVVLVISAVGLAAAIVQTVLTKKKKTAENDATEDLTLQ